MAYNVTLITGDGTGPELAEAARRVVDATGVKINWDVKEAGVDAVDKYGTPMPEETIESIKKNKVALKAPVTTPVGKGFRSVNVFLRQSMDLYAGLRPAKFYRGVKSRYEDVDLVVVRENTEGLYAGIEFQKGDERTEKFIDFVEAQTDKRIRDGSGISLRPISEFATERIVKFAFEYARENNRKKVSAVHKANILKFSDGLFLDVARNVASQYEDIEFNDVIVDNMCMQLVQKPELYDVLVLPNLFGDIISDLCAGLVGGLGVAPGANIGDEIAVFEAVHGSAPKYKGMDKVNPCSLILSGMLMLKHLDEKEAAQNLENAIAKVIAEGKYVTYDLKPNRDDPDAAKTSEMADAIIKELEK